MAEKENSVLDERERIEQAVAAEFRKNDDIVEYIQESNIDALRARFADAEEDESIRNQDMIYENEDGSREKNSHRDKPPKHDDRGTGNKREPVFRNEKENRLEDIFDSAVSEYDSDAVSFNDIAYRMEEINSRETKDSFTEDEPYDTHTKVVFLDNTAYDGIKRNTEEELFAAFTDSDRKRRRRKKHDRQ